MGFFKFYESAVEKVINKMEALSIISVFLKRKGHQDYLKVAMYAATLFIASSLAKDMAMGRICIPNISPLFVPRIPDLKFFNCLTTYQSCSPVNLGEFKVPLGIVEYIQNGEDITVVSYGSTLRIVEKACIELKSHGISVDLIDAQTLIPFDTNNEIISSLKKTNKLIIVDEDYNGGASAFILKKIITLT